MVLGGEGGHATLSAQDDDEAAVLACRRTLDIFCAVLGSVCGNVALTYGARGGVYLAGGIAPRIVDELQASAFRARFESKGRFAGYLSAIPVFVIDSDVSPALLGASRAIDLESAGGAGSES